MRVSLGIDTGGTYTDAVLIKQSSGEIIFKTKVLTTKNNLCIGIRKAFKRIIDEMVNICSIESIGIVGLSTTLATNAIAEGHGSQVGLLLIGYNHQTKGQGEFRDILDSNYIANLRGGHDVHGDEVAAMDLEATREAILAIRSSVQAFAISGYFSVRNPEHEMITRELVEKLTGLPTTCGSELSNQLDAINRARTAVLNAKLIPLITDLIANVRLTLQEFSICAPLMVVKGDGSFVNWQLAIRRPIETILSGPAASAVGALHLSGKEDAWVVDMGGTTTDILGLKNGKLKRSFQGPLVAGRKTMVEAVDVHTVGLGGDSHVRIERGNSLTIGPRRVIPLCLLGSQQPKMSEELENQERNALRHEFACQFVVYNREPEKPLAAAYRGIINEIKRWSMPLFYYSRSYDSWLVLRRVAELEEQFVFQRGGFTPTDALHVLGLQKQWDTRASWLGAKILGKSMNLNPQEFCDNVLRMVSNQVTTEIVSKILSEEMGSSDVRIGKSGRSICRWFLTGHLQRDELRCRLTLRRPIVGVGGAGRAFLPLVARHLNTELLIPDHAEVASAVGAVAGSVIQSLKIWISTMGAREGIYRAHLPEGILDFPSLEAALKYVQKEISNQVRELAIKAGAAQVEVKETREDRMAATNLPDEKEVYLGSMLTFTALGRPNPVAR